MSTNSDPFRPEDTPPTPSSTGQQPPPPPYPTPQAPPPPPSPSYAAPQPPPPYGAPQPPPPYGYAGAAPLSPQDEKNWSLGAHLGVLLVGFLAPLVIWLVYKGRGPFLEHHAKESLNFQITVTIALFAFALLSLVLVGIFLLLALIPWMIVMPIIAAVKASNGEWYRYPLTLRLVS